MPLEPQEITEEISGEGLGFLRGCLVEGDSEQRAQERRVRRRALVISILLQSAALTVLVVVSLFGKTDRIALANMTPIPPYSPRHSSSHTSGPQQHPNGPKNACHFCAPTKVPPTIPTHDPRTPGDGKGEIPLDGLGPGIPGAPEGLIPLADPRQKGPDREHVEHQVARPRVAHMTQLDPAMLIHRVEPVYPPLARQTHREGRVELRAIIATDGSIQSLQIVASDPLFDRSALEAVQQWRYKPTILNGQPVEIDTHITVIYTMQH